MRQPAGRRRVGRGVLGGLAAACVVTLTSHPAAAQELRQGSVVTDTAWSQALGASKSLVVYLPPSYGTDRTRRYPVAYYLHGTGGDETNWVKLGGMAVVMDSLVAAGMPEMIVAMPDGDDSYYTTYNVLLDAAGCRRMLAPTANADRDCVAWPHYDDYVAYDVVRHLDAKYRTQAAAANRAIAGLSMGGYGAVTLALNNPKTFSVAASHSGVLSPLEFAPAPVGRAPFTRSAGDSTAAAGFGARNAARYRVIFGADSSSWRSRDPATIASRIVDRGAPMPALFIDCGTADIFLPQNRAFVEALQSRNVPVEYREWAGAHNWTYWRAHVGQSLRWIAARIAAPMPRSR